MIPIRHRGRTRPAERPGPAGGDQSCCTIGTFHSLAVVTCRTSKNGVSRNRQRDFGLSGRVREFDDFHPLQDIRHDADPVGRGHQPASVVAPIGRRPRRAVLAQRRVAETPSLSTHAAPVEHSRCGGNPISASHRWHYIGPEIVPRACCDPSCSSVNRLKDASCIL